MNWICFFFYQKRKYSAIWWNKIWKHNNQLQNHNICLYVYGYQMVSIYKWSVSANECKRTKKKQASNIYIVHCKSVRVIGWHSASVLNIELMEFALNVVYLKYFGEPKRPDTIENSRTWKGLNKIEYVTCVESHRLHCIVYSLYIYVWW